MKKEMDTITAVLQSLKQKGQDSEIFVIAKGLLSLKGKTYRAHEIKILKTYRFEGESDPADQAIIYLIRTHDGNEGFCIDAYGMYSNYNSDLFTEFIHDAEIVTSHHPGNSSTRKRRSFAVL
jgi:hypothetical protein